MQRAHPGEEMSNFLVMISGKPSGKLPILYFVSGLLDEQQAVNEIFRQMEEASQSQALVLMGI